MIKEVKDKTMTIIEDLLKSRNEGLTIQGIMDVTGLARHTILSRLHHLIGEGKVKIRQINMAKLHYWNDANSVQENRDIFSQSHKENIRLQPLKEEHIRKRSIKQKNLSSNELNLPLIKEQIMSKLKSKKINKVSAQIMEQRVPLAHVVDKSRHKPKGKTDEYIKTGVVGFDDLFEQGIPKGSSILVAGGAGSGKTILCLQTIKSHAEQGEKCLYMSFEESEEKLMHHMEDFGWDPGKLVKKGSLLIKRFNPFDITRSVDALLLEAKGELLIDIEPVIFPEDFKPEIVVVDSLTAIASAFTGKEDSYRIYIEQLFRFFEKIGATSFLITETSQIPTIFSQTGVEEFLADGVIVLYNLKRGNVRENAIEVLKLRGAKHQKKIVAMQITSKGIVVYPEQEVFSEIE